MKLLTVLYVYVQWNPFIAATLGEQNFGRGVAFIGGVVLYTNCSFVTWVPTEVAFIQWWPLRGIPL